MEQKFRGKPLFHQSKVERSSSNGKAIVYLDIDPKNLLAIHYQVEGEYECLLPAFEEICQSLDGVDEKTFENFTFLETKMFLPLPEMMVMEAYWQYLGSNKNLSELTKQSSKGLICRCFGVFRETILEFLSTNPEAEVVAVTGETKAGGACTSCTEDIQEMIENFRRSQFKRDPADRWDEFGKRVRPGGMIPLDFVLLADLEIKNWLKREEISQHHKIEITSLSGYQVELFWEAEDKNPVILSALEDYLKDQLEKNITLKLPDDSGAPLF